MDGGFMTFGGGSQSSPVGNEGGKQRKTFVTPVSVKQIRECTLGGDDAIKIDGKDIVHVELVGIVRSFEHKETKFVCSVEDHSGVIDVTHWTNEGADDAAASIRDNLYVHCIGQIKDYQGKKTVNAYKITHITNPNQVTAHLMAVVHTHLIATRGNKDFAGGRASMGGPPPVYGAAVDLSLHGGAGAYHHQPMHGGHAGGHVQHANGLSGDQNLVLDKIKTFADSEVGISLDQIIAEVKGRMDANTVKKIIEFLSGEGHVYSTVDDIHFKSTD